MRFATATLAAALFAITAQPAFAQQGAEGGPALIEAPPLGVEQEIDRGLFVDMQIGGFFTMNTNAGTTGGRSVGNVQPYVGFAVGYDLTENVVVGGGLSYGASNGPCYVDPLSCTRSFALVSANAYAGYFHGITHEWYVGGKLTGGVSFLTPEPVMADEIGGFATGFNGGLLLSTEFHTHLDHFVVGLDVGGLFVSGGQASFPAIAIYPRIKYVF